MFTSVNIPFFIKKFENPYFLVIPFSVNYEFEERIDCLMIR